MTVLDEFNILYGHEEMKTEPTPITAGVDRREIPRYGVPEAALYLHVPEKTLRSWLYGRQYTTGGEVRFSLPLIDPADANGGRLSFFNLVEAHILKSTRERDEVPMSAVRAALDYASSEPSRHPLIEKKFVTEGRYLFEQKLEQIVNSSMFGQFAFDPIILSYLERIDRDTIGDPSALYPFVPNKPQSKVVTIKPGLSSGVPTITGTGISIPILYGRFKAGDSIDDLADDYELKSEDVKDAIAYLDAA